MAVSTAQPKNIWIANDGTPLILPKKCIIQTCGRISRGKVIKYEFVSFDRQPKLRISDVIPIKTDLFSESHVISFPSLLELNLVDTYLPRRLKFTKQTLRNKLRNMGIKLCPRQKTSNFLPLLGSSPDRTMINLSSSSKEVIFRTDFHMRDSNPRLQNKCTLSIKEILYRKQAERLLTETLQDLRNTQFDESIRDYFANMVIPHK